MFDVSLPFEIPVVSIGSLAGRRVEVACVGQILSLSKSTFYIQVPGQLLCIGNSGIWCGPLNIVTAAGPGTDWLASGLQRHMRAHVSRTRIAVGNRFVFKLSDCVPWSPAPSTSRVEADDVRRGLGAVRRAAMQFAPIDGLGRSLVGAPDLICENAVMRAAAPLIEAARSWAQHMISNAETRPPMNMIWVHKLSGLGPGLTPSGDDFLGGMMIALHLLGNAAAAQELWQAVHPLAKCNNNLISHAHLEAASEGLAAEPIHDMVAAILVGNSGDIRGHCSGINRLGHSSGWDIMAGIGIVLDAWLQTRDHQANDIDK